MITVFLTGGLGNQMFQIATAYSFAIDNNDHTEFDFNTSYTPHQGHNATKYKNNIYKKFDHSDQIKIENKFTQQGQAYEIIPYNKNLQLVGYFQSEKFFFNNKKSIIDKFLEGLYHQTDKVKNVTNFLKNIGPSPLVSVHIRRGDYYKWPNIHTHCTLDYYNKALSFIKDRIGIFTPVFLSDDKQWCEKNFNGLMSPFTSEIEDMILMSKCDHNIIANSSFSWWGAYLNKNKNKIVIGPKKWFGPHGAPDQADIIPETWIKI